MSAKASQQDYVDFLAFQLAAQGNARLSRPTPRFFTWSAETRERWRAAAESAVAGWAEQERRGLERARREVKR